MNQALSVKADAAAVEDALKDKAPKSALTAGLNRKANKVRLIAQPSVLGDADVGSSDGLCECMPLQSDLDNAIESLRLQIVDVAREHGRMIAAQVCAVPPLVSTALHATPSSKPKRLVLEGGYQGGARGGGGATCAREPRDDRQARRHALHHGTLQSEPLWKPRPPHLNRDDIRVADAGVGWGGRGPTPTTSRSCAHSGCTSSRS